MFCANCGTNNDDDAVFAQIVANHLPKWLGKMKAQNWLIIH
jgi:hypothetical protein